MDHPRPTQRVPGDVPEVKFIPFGGVGSMNPMLAALGVVALLVATSADRIALGAPEEQRIIPSEADPFGDNALPKQVLKSEINAVAIVDGKVAKRIAVGDTIRVSGEVQLKDQAHKRMTKAVVLIVEKLPNGKDLVHNSALLEIEQISPRRYRFLHDVRGPLRAGSYRIKVRYDGLVIANGVLEVP